MFLHAFENLLKFVDSTLWLHVISFFYRSSYSFCYSLLELLLLGVVLIQFCFIFMPPVRRRFEAKGYITDKEEEDRVGSPVGGPSDRGRSSTARSSYPPPSGVVRQSSSVVAGGSVSWQDRLENTKFYTGDAYEHRVLGVLPFDTYNTLRERVRVGTADSREIQKVDLFLVCLYLVECLFFRFIFTNLVF